MDTILGAGGSIANELVQVLAASGRPFRLASRRGTPNPLASATIAADLTDRAQTLDAVAGSDVVYLLAGLKYDHKLWAEAWPRIVDNTLEACKRAGARLVFFDNVYMYGRVHGTMTEETPFHPTSRKGEIRARIATRLIEAWRSGSVTAMIARSADFYGPGTANGVPNLLVFDPLSKGKKAQCLVSDALPHSYTYTPDAGRSLAMLAASDTAWNQTWHLPTAPDPLTGREFIEHAAAALDVPAKYAVLSRTMVRVAGWFNPMVGEVYEMLYQNDSPYLFDSTKFARAFGVTATPYVEGIRATAALYRA